MPEQGADVYVNGMKVGKTPYRSDKLSEGVYKVKVVQLMYAPQEREVQIVKGQTQRVAFDMAATFAEVIIRAECPQAEIYVNNIKKGVGVWKGRLTEGIYQLKSHMDSHRDGTKSVEIKSGINQEVTIPAPTAIYGILNVSSNPTGGVIKIDGKEVGYTPDVISKVLIGERKIEILKDGCATSEQVVMIEEGKVKELKVSLSRGKEVYIEAFEPVNIEIDGISYGKAPCGGLLSYGRHNLVAKNSSGEFEIQELFDVTESSSDNLLIRNKPFPRDITANREVVINGIKYGFNYNSSNNDVTEIFAYDNYARLRKVLPIPRYCYFSKYSIYGDIQGCFVLGENVWINGKWKEIKELSGLLGAKNTCIASYKDHGYLYMVKEYQDHFEVVRRDIVTDQEQILFSYITKLKPYGDITVVDETHLQYKGSLWTKDKKGGIKNAKESFDFYIRVDSIPFPPLMCGSYLMDKEDYIGEGSFLINRTPTFSASSIDWSSFPEKYYSKAKGQVYIIGNAAYVPVIRSTSVDFKESFKKWEPSFGYMKNYIAKGSNITLSINAIYKYDFQVKTWNKCPYKFISSKTGKVYTSNPAPNSSSHPSFSIGVNGKYLVIDSQYRFNTEINSWE